jgi:integrase
LEEHEEMGKRGNGEGTISKRSDGRWMARLTLEDGTRKTLYGKTREAVAAKLTDALKSRKDGLPLPSDRYTVRQHFTGWLESVKATLKPRTHQRYEQLIRLHVLPVLGKAPLNKLTPQDLRRLYSGRQDAGLSSTTVHQLHAVVHHALKQALRDGLVARNVADLVSPPRVAQREMQTLSAAQARTLLSHASGERLEAIYVLALSTGMRQGELLALRWKDVDLDCRSVHVLGTLQRTKSGLTISAPKTSGSRRRVALTAIATDALRRHKAAQNEERLRLGGSWEDCDLVFANEVGRPIEAGNLLRRSYWPLLEKAELPRIRFHDLRHTAATLALAQNQNPKKVSEMLGHSKVGITLDLYSHVTPTMQDELADALNAVLSG